MTNEIIETIVFLIPGFICFEIFYSLSGIDIKLSDKKYYFICLSISSIVYFGLFGWFSGVRYVQELGYRLIEVKTILFIYFLCIVGSFLLANIVRFIWFPNYYLRLREPWPFFLEEINKSEATEVTIITSDGSEYYGRLRMFAHKNDEQREIILEDVSKIKRDEMGATEIDSGTQEILFTKDDIRRIIYNNSTRKDPNFLEKLFRIRR